MKIKSNFIKGALNKLKNITTTFMNKLFLMQENRLMISQLTN